MRRKKSNLPKTIVILILTVLLIYTAALILQLRLQVQLPVALPTISNQAYELNSLHGKVIILDPGHGYGNTNVFEDYDEHVRMLLLAHKIKPLLEEAGATVHMTRPTAADVLLPARAAITNKVALEEIRLYLRYELIGLAYSEDEEKIELAQSLQRDIVEIDRLIYMLNRIINDPDTYGRIYMNFPFDRNHEREIHPDLQRVFEFQDDYRIRNRFLMISLHSNAPPNPIDTRINGADAFFISNNLRVSRSYFGNYTSVNQSAYFAERIIENIDTIGIRRGNAFGTNLFVLRETNIPAVLVENGFHTNPEDRAKLLCDEFLEELAAVYLETIIGYFTNINYVPNYRPTMPRILERVLDMF